MLKVLFCLAVVYSTSLATRSDVEEEASQAKSAVNVGARSEIIKVATKRHDNAVSPQDTQVPASLLEAVAATSTAGAVDVTDAAAASTTKSSTATQTTVVASAASSCAAPSDVEGGAAPHACAEGGLIAQGGTCTPVCEGMLWSDELQLTCKDGKFDPPTFTCGQNQNEHCVAHTDDGRECVFPFETRNGMKQNACTQDEAGDEVVMGETIKRFWCSTRNQKSSLQYYEWGKCKSQVPCEERLKLSEVPKSKTVTKKRPTSQHAIYGVYACLSVALVVVLGACVCGSRSV